MLYSLLVTPLSPLAHCPCAVRVAACAVSPLAPRRRPPAPACRLSAVGCRLSLAVPIHPACAMFVSNHPSLEAPGGTAAGANGADGLAGAACQPTASVYLPGPLGEAYDWLCCFSNFHTEHHDFPDVPAFKLRELRDACPSFYSDEALAGCRDGWLETMRRTFEGRGFYACSGVGAGAALSEAEIRLEGQSS